MGLEALARVSILLVVRLQLDGGNGTSLLELVLELFLDDVVGDTGDENVGLEHFLLVLDDGVLERSLGLQVRLLSVLVGSGQDSLLTVELQLHVDLLEGFFGGLMIFEIDKTMA